MNTLPIIIKIYPNIEQCLIKNYLKCTIQNCESTFRSESNLNMHLIKSHKKLNLNRNEIEEKWYFCPQINCPWNNSKHFINIKGLRQHYMKMHLDKKFQCKTCKKSFYKEELLTRHCSYCNIWFNCLDCKISYANYDTLTTHCRRKNHKLLKKQHYLKSDKITVVKVPSTSREIQIRLSPNNNSTVSTQTELITFRDNSCNTTEDIEKNTFGTQTHHQYYNNNSTIRANTPDLLDFDTNFFNCNIETQTDLFNNELFNQEDYSNMCTQTSCNDILLNNFTDIQTQTGFNRDETYLRSVESQTLMSSSPSSSSSSSYSSVLLNNSSIFKDIVHSETQTDTELKTMLEIINS